MIGISRESRRAASERDGRNERDAVTSRPAPCHAYTRWSIFRHARLMKSSEKVCFCENTARVRTLQTGNSIRTVVDPRNAFF